MLSLSTAYNIGRHSSWRRLVAEVRKLGIEAVELSVEIPEEWLPDILRSVGKGEIRISSIHNYCPALKSLPAGRSVFSGYLLTSDDAGERRLAVQYTKRTIDLAHETGARAVVLHAGEVETEPSGREFFRYIQQFGHQGRVFENYREALLQDRKRKAGPYVDRLLAGLDELLAHAADRKVLLGLENRYFPHEIPDSSDLRLIFDRFEGGPVGYWHDTGHAEIFVRLGILPRHSDLLDAFGDKLIGMHIHDIKGISDHHTPGSGDFDFSRLVPYLREGTIRVIEAHAKQSDVALDRSLQVLAASGITVPPVR